jgi:ubiquinol-cytochrome c reductase cytochrome c subunit
MSRSRTAASALARVAAAALAVLALAGGAWAQPPSGVVRPDNERGLSPLELGSELYAGNCAVCHGIQGRGIRRPRESAGGIHGQGPSLQGVGALAADFYLRTGYMPLGQPGEQPGRRIPPFTEREIRALVAYVASLGHGPAIPRPLPAVGSLSEGFRLFTEHCAGCHQVVARGGVVTDAKVPPLEDATPTQIAEAVRIGPYLMPRFPKTQLTDDELDSIIAYVERSKHPVDQGGWGLGNVGPVPEGMVTWLIAALLLIAVCMVIGERRRA